MSRSCVEMAVGILRVLFVNTCNGVGPARWQGELPLKCLSGSPLRELRKWVCKESFDICAVRSLFFSGKLSELVSEFMESSRRSKKPRPYEEKYRRKLYSMARRCGYS